MRFLLDTNVVLSSMVFCIVATRAQPRLCERRMHGEFSAVTRRKVRRLIRPRSFSQVMDQLEIIQFIGAMGFVVSLAPQFVRTIRRKSAYDVSLWFLVILLLSSALLFYFALATRPRLVWFAISYFTNIIVWGTVLYYRLRPATAAPA